MDTCGIPLTQNNGTVFNNVGANNNNDNKKPIEEEFGKYVQFWSKEVKYMSTPKFYMSINNEEGNNYTKSILGSQREIVYVIGVCITTTRIYMS